MAIRTIAEVLRAMRRLDHTTTGHLVGIGINDAWRMPGGKSTATGWPARVIEQLATAGADTMNPPVYLVLSDDIPVCWLTGDGIVAISTAADLTRAQIRHRDQAARSLADLHRHTLAWLADALDAKEGRLDDLSDRDRPERVGSLRVANPAHPARAWQVPISGDLDQSRQRIAEVTGTDQPLVITAYGYGEYALRAHRLPLEMLCAINDAAGRRGLPAAVVGDWLAAEGGLAGLVSAEELPTAFNKAYIGRFTHELSYTAFRLDELGWEKTLRELGAIEFFNVDAFNRYLFNSQVRAIRDTSTDGGGIVVCRRQDR